MELDRKALDRHLTREEPWTAEEDAAYDAHFFPEQTECLRCGYDVDTHIEVTREDRFGNDYLDWECPGRPELEVVR